MYYSILFYIENSNFNNEIENKIDLLNSELRKRFLYNIEIDIRSELKSQNEKLDKIKKDLISMVKTFEVELKSALNKVFNDKYVTEMNKIQNEFIISSKELSRQFEVLRNENEKSMQLINTINYLTEKITLFADSISNTNTEINKIKENLKDLTNKYYSKDQLNKMVDALNNTIDNNINKLSELNEKYEWFKMK